MKHCTHPSHCGDNPLSLSCFAKRKQNSDGHNSWCKSCYNEVQRQSRVRRAQIKGRVVTQTIGRPKHPVTRETRIIRNLRAIRQRCKVIGIPFSITLADLLPLPTHCSDLGIELNYFSSERSSNSASIDKIKPEVGYVKGNVRIVSSKANVMKQDATPEELVYIAKRWLEQFS